MTKNINNYSAAVGQLAKKSNSTLCIQPDQQCQPNVIPAQCIQEKENFPSMGLFVLYALPSSIVVKIYLHNIEMSNNHFMAPTIYPKDEIVWSTLSNKEVRNSRYQERKQSQKSFGRNEEYRPRISYLSRDINTDELRYYISCNSFWYQCYMQNPP